MRSLTLALPRGEAPSTAARRRAGAARPERRLSVRRCTLLNLVQRCDQWLSCIFDLPLSCPPAALWQLAASCATPFVQCAGGCGVRRTSTHASSHRAALTNCTASLFPGRRPRCGATMLDLPVVQLGCTAGLCATLSADPISGVRTKQKHDEEYNSDSFRFSLVHQTLITKGVQGR